MNPDCQVINERLTTVVKFGESDLEQENPAVKRLNENTNMFLHEAERVLISNVESHFGPHNPDSCDCSEARCRPT